MSKYKDPIDPRVTRDEARVQAKYEVERRRNAVTKRLNAEAAAQEEVRHERAMKAIDLLKKDLGIVRGEQDNAKARKAFTKGTRP